MADQNKQLPSFSFGSFGTAPSSSGGPDSNAAPKSLFGSTPASNPFGAATSSGAPTTSSSPFGGFGATSGAQGGGLFGSSTGQPSSLFGGATANATGAGLFGGGNKPTGSGFSFGKKPDQASGATSTPFSNLATPDKTPSTGGMGGLGNPFGSAPPNSSAPPPGSITPSSSQAGPGMFGGVPSTTPAGNPPQPTGLGQSFKPPPVSFNTTSGSAVPSLFSSSKPTESGPPKTPAPFGSNIFGSAPPPSTGGGAFSNQSGQHASNPFGRGPPEGKMPDPISPAGPLPPSKPTISFGPPVTTGNQPAGTTASSQPSSSWFSSTTNAPASSAPSAPFSTFKPSTSASNPSSSASTSGPSPFPPASAPGTTRGFSLPTSSITRPGTITASGPFAPSTSTTSGPTTTGTGATTAAPPTSGAPGSSVLGNPAAGPAPSAQSRLRNKTMDEIITRWASDLTKYQKEFQNQAEKVAAWDRMLVDNSEQIQKLYGRTLEAERATAEVEKQLSAVEGQQEELSYWLDSYENDVEEMMARQVGQGEALQGPDQERERTYKLAERLSERLDDMGRDLSVMIEEINGASAGLSKTTKDDEPITQIVRILNSHLSQLQQIDQGTAALQAKVSAAQRASQTLVLPQGQNGLGNNAADDFYRSYMGRR